MDPVERRYAQRDFSGKIRTEQPVSLIDCPRTKLRNQVRDPADQALRPAILTSRPPPKAASNPGKQSQSLARSSGGFCRSASSTPTQSLSRPGTRDRRRRLTNVLRQRDRPDFRIDLDQPTKNRPGFRRSNHRPHDDLERFETILAEGRSSKGRKARTICSTSVGRLPASFFRGDHNRERALRNVRPRRSSAKENHRPGTEDDRGRGGSWT